MKKILFYVFLSRANGQNGRSSVNANNKDEALKWAKEKYPDWEVVVVPENAKDWHSIALDELEIENIIKKEKKCNI